MKAQDKYFGTKEKILTRVLPLFLVNNYESITIGMMEDVTRITRGTIYRYFSNKEDVFKQAVVRYYDSPQNVLFAMPPDKCNLRDYWNLKIQQLKSAHTYLRECGVIVDLVAISHYIEIEGMRIIPAFRDLIVSHQHNNLKYWSTVLRNTSDLLLNPQNISYKRAAQIYHSLFLQICSSFPNGKLQLPNIKFP